MRELSINNFKNEVSVAFRGEEYRVRDNGSVCRVSKPNQRKRRLDGVWTFGNQCRTNGYRRTSGLMIHKIIATAFFGEQPSPAHVVDHIDTNRKNNRVENLRWVTRLENLASNPKTLQRIVQKWGSIAEMLEDPARAEKVEPLCNRSWMPRIANEVATNPSDTKSFTPLAMQRNWKTPSAFPSCPDEISDQPLEDYLEQLPKGSIFSHNRYGESEVEISQFSEDRVFLSVVTRIHGGVKDWGLSKISYENGLFVHEALGTFFGFEGASKRHTELIGREWTGGETFDDFC